MVEKANHILKDKVAAWRSDHQSSSWVASLPEVISGMNAQRSSVTGRSPYEIVFGQVPHGTRVSYLERGMEEVLEEDGTAASGTIGFGESREELQDTPSASDIQEPNEELLSVVTTTIATPGDYAVQDNIGQVESEVGQASIHENDPSAG